MYAVLPAAGSPGDTLEPWASNTHPSDVPRHHVEEISTGEYRYSVTHGGTMDGQNCRTPMGVGIGREGAVEQTWQSNRAVRMENVGETDVVNPWLSNGRNRFRNLDEIVAGAVAPGMSDKEKATALWFQQIRHRFHRAGFGPELGDAVKVYNVYGHNPCGCDANIMGGLWRRVGLDAGPSRLVGHAVAQVHYDGGWHLMDADLQHLFLLRDNETVASDRDLARDHDLIKRTHTLGILLADDRARDEAEAAMFVCEDEIRGARGRTELATMDMTLRPGEALVWRWGHLTPAKHMWPDVRPTYPATVCNGLWEYWPDFSRDTWTRGAVAVEHIQSTPKGLAAEHGKTGTIVWTVRSPYAFVGGRLEVEGAGAEFAVSSDGQGWEDVECGNLDGFFPPDGSPRYEYRLRCQLSGGARIKRLGIVNDLQMALLALPEMVVGENAFVYTDQSRGERRVRITHEWVERSVSTPPGAPPSAIHPPDGGETNGTDIGFRWSAPKELDGGRVADYHFELSDRADMRWPLSMSFYKLISRTADRGKARFTLPNAGLLTPDKQYYWRVRAKNGRGVWGPWSRTWSFTPRGPAYPLDVILDYDRDKGVGVLRWRPNPMGRRPVRYRVYGSDEKGFSASDEPYAVNVGICKALASRGSADPESRSWPEQPGSRELVLSFPANFIAETTATELAVLDEGVASPEANKTYYRVVAEDEQGTRSGASDYATAPRPVIYSTPPVAAQVGMPYRYQVAATRSLGDLRLRMVGGREIRSYWDIEQPSYALQQGPRWLELDQATGVLLGTPDGAGQVEVVVTATIERERRELDEVDLGWGRETVTSVTTETVGTAIQRFVVDVTA